MCIPCLRAGLVYSGILLSSEGLCQGILAETQREQNRLDKFFFHPTSPVLIVAGVTFLFRELDNIVCLIECSFTFGSDFQVLYTRGFRNAVAQNIDAMMKSWKYDSTSSQRPTWNWPCSAPNLRWR